MALLWLGTFVVFSLLYLATAQRGANWQDSGSRQWRILIGEYDDPLGLALVHPLYVAIGRVIAAIPIGTVTARMNALSGLAMAAALANLACVVRMLTGRGWVGLAAAGMLSVCHTVWWLATITESYTLNAALFTAELWLLVALLRRPRWPLLVGLALAAGLNWSVHNVALLALPVYGVVAVALVVRRRLPAWSLVAAAAAFIAGASAYLAMIARQAQATGDLAGAIQSALFGSYRSAVLNVSASWPMLRVNAALAAMNFVSFLPVLAVVGWAALGRLQSRATAWALAAITAIEVLFVVRYPIPDQFMFLLPSLAMTAIAAGIGLGVMAGASVGWRRAAAVASIVSVLLPPVVYAYAPALAKRAGVQVRRARELPFRDEARYWLVPWKHTEQSADRFARAALAEAGPDGVILADMTARDTLRVVQKADRLGPTVVVADGKAPLGDYDSDPAGFRRALGGRRMYVLSPIRGYVSPGILADAEFHKRPRGVLYEVIWKDAAPSLPTVPQPARTSAPN
ncbi:MAG: DUF2723 domain-containing protein [Phycisphaerae bacterium]|nr:DUF2723 domain-containing protein [Phycisphaerae bacterium]